MEEESPQQKAKLGRAAVVFYNAVLCLAASLSILGLMFSDCAPIAPHVGLCVGLITQGCLSVASFLSSGLRSALSTCSYLVAAALLVLSGYLWYVSDGQSLQPALPSELILMSASLAPNIIALVLNDPRAKRIRIRYSLRTLSIAVILVALLLGFFFRFTFNTREERFATQKEAMHAIEEAGGYVGLDDYWVTAVHLGTLRKPASIDLIKKVASLPHLNSLDLSSAVIPDEVLMCLAECRELRFLYLGQAVVSDEAVRILRKRMPELRIEAEWGRWADEDGQQIDRRSKSP